MRFKNYTEPFHQKTLIFLVLFKQYIKFNFRNSSGNWALDQVELDGTLITATLNIRGTAPSGKPICVLILNNIFELKKFKLTFSSIWILIWLRRGFHLPIYESFNVNNSDAHLEYDSGTAIHHRS